MKIIYFIRHGPLQGKFANYGSLEYADMNNLLLKKVAPEIDAAKTRKMLKGLSFVKSCQKIYCSTQNRGMETARLLQELCGAFVVSTSLLDEVDFDEGILTTEEVKQGMIGIRKAVLQKWYASTCSENFTDSILRFKDFLDMVQKADEKEIICVTHGWFMRLIHLYQQKGKVEDITLEELLKSKMYHNLGCIKIKLKEENLRRYCHE